MSTGVPSPPSVAGSPSSSSSPSLRTRRYSHHSARFSRLCHCNRLASNARVCCSEARSAGSSGTPTVSAASTATNSGSGSRKCSAGCAVEPSGRGTSCPASRTSWRRASSHSRRWRVLTVVAVVGPDRVEDGLLTLLPPALVLDDARSGVLDLCARARRRVVELLERLDRVRLHADAQPLADDGVEVDQPLAAEQRVDLVDAGAVALGEAFEDGGLVGRVVVDVHAGVVRPGGHQVIDGMLEGPALGGRIVRPPGRELVGGVGDAPEYSRPRFTASSVSCSAAGAGRQDGRPGRSGSAPCLRRRRTPVTPS